MAIFVKEMKRWISTLPDDWHVAIDDGGLTIIAIEDPEVYYEIGGIPLYEFDDLSEQAKERARDWFREGDEYVDDTIRINEYEFTEDGKIA